MDQTETPRRIMTAIINSKVESDDEDAERERLTGLYGKVWDTKELQKDFEVISFLAPFVICKHKSTGTRGALYFQHYPRFYFTWNSLP